MASGSLNANGGIIGTCPALLEILRQVGRVAGTTLPILILGESGTGKELVARHAHERSQRSSGPFIVINCGALPKDLVESILFGFEKGAFTGAMTAQPGKFEQAHSGTIFLDELGELPRAQQVKLLRVLQEGTVERIGGKPRKVDVRVVAATNRNLRDMMAEGTFREDLYYRVSGMEVTLPPLRERGDDIVVLAEKTLARAVAKHKLDPLTFSDDARDVLVAHDWPGNVREIERVVETAAVLAAGAAITKSEITDRLWVDVRRRPAVGDVLDGGRPSAPAEEYGNDPLDRAARAASLLLRRQPAFGAREFGTELGVGEAHRKRLLRRLVEAGQLVQKGAARATRYSRP